MKLLYCRSCEDIVPLNRDIRECICKLASGEYRKDGLTVDIYTLNRHTALVLGFANSSFKNAVANQLVFGDLAPTMPYCGKIVAPGRDFKAFVIPESADSVVWHYTSTEQ